MELRMAKYYTKLNKFLFENNKIIITSNKNNNQSDNIWKNICLYVSIIYLANRWRCLNENFIYWKSNIVSVIQY